MADARLETARCLIPPSGVNVIGIGLGLGGSARAWGPGEGAPWKDGGRGAGVGL